MTLSSKANPKHWVLWREKKNIKNLFACSTLPRGEARRGGCSYQMLHTWSQFVISELSKWNGTQHNPSKSMLISRALLLDIYCHMFPVWFRSQSQQNKFRCQEAEWIKNIFSCRNLSKSSRNQKNEENISQEVTKKIQFRLKEWKTMDNEGKLKQEEVEEEQFCFNFKLKSNFCNFYFLVWCATLATDEWESRNLT